MKKIRSEFVNNYSTYSFSYCEYAICESQDDLKEVYETGHLPYSGSTELGNYFYLARSLRINLKNFSLSSENKRIQKKLASTNFVARTYDGFKDVPDVLKKDLNILFLEYFKRVHGDLVMTEERVNFIFNFKFVNLVRVYFLENIPVGIVILIDDGKDNRQFWFSAYAKNFDKTSFGLNMMLLEAMLAKEEGRKYFYLGTAYGEKAKYKLNFKELEYFDGNVWVKDRFMLKKVLASDSGPKNSDLIKTIIKLF